MQYGGTSLVQMLLALFAWVIAPRSAPARIVGLFPVPARHRVEVPDVVLDRVAIPALRGAARAALRLRLLQKGQIQLYVLYILFALLGLLLVR